MLPLTDAIANTIKCDVAHTTSICKTIVYTAHFNQYDRISLNRRPLSITIISWFFISVGTIALAYHLQPQYTAEFRANPSIGNDLIWICLIRFLAIVSGIFMLRGSNWARWLLVMWLAYHVGLSAFHSLFQAVVHGTLFAVIAYFLFRRPASEFFHPNSLSPTQGPPGEHIKD